MTEKMSDARRLRLAKGLYGMVPQGFPCKTGCFSCCKTIVQMLRVEWAHLKTLPIFMEMEATLDETKRVYEVVDPKDEELVRVTDERGWCPFVDGKTGACRVYNDRPLTCRVYGQHFIMPCEEGVDPPAGVEVENHVLDKWRRLAGKGEAVMAPGRTTEEARAIFTAVMEWRQRTGQRAGLPPREEQAALHARAEQILGKKFA